jgi:hypothetical protein
MDDLFSAEYTCVPAIRQVLIFLLCNEEEACRAITSAKIKSQFEPPHVFLLFGRFIEVSLGKPDIAKFRSLLSPQQQAVMAASAATGTAVELPAAAPGAATSTATTTAGAEASKNAAKGGKKTAASSTATDDSVTSTTPAATGKPDAPASTSPGGAATAKALRKTQSTLTAAAALTTNMRSAIFLHMSERLVIEVMINRFINLFPESYHEVGYSILAHHLVSTEINVILEQLCRPANLLRASSCMVCGAGGPISKCSRCKTAFYCSAACQKEHWVHHKKTCGKG